MSKTVHLTNFLQVKINTAYMILLVQTVSLPVQNLSMQRFGENTTLRDATKPSTSYLPPGNYCISCLNIHIMICSFLSRPQTCDDFYPILLIHAHSSSPPPCNNSHHVLTCLFLRTSPSIQRLLLSIVFYVKLLFSNCFQLDWGLCEVIVSTVILTLKKKRNITEGSCFFCLVELEHWRHRFCSWRMTRMV